MGIIHIIAWLVYCSSYAIDKDTINKSGCCVSPKDLQENFLPLGFTTSIHFISSESTYLIIMKLSVFCVKN